MLNINSKNKKLFIPKIAIKRILMAIIVCVKKCRQFVGITAACTQKSYLDFFGRPLRANFVRVGTLSKFGLKITAVILVQAFLLLEFSWTSPISLSLDKSALAPAVNIDKKDVQVVFEKLKDERTDSDEFFFEEGEEVLGDRIAGSKVSFVTAGGNNSATSNGSGAGINGEGEGILFYPPPRGSFIQGIINFTMNLFAGTLVNQDDEEQKRLLREYFFNVSKNVLFNVSQGDKKFTKKEVKEIMETLLEGNQLKRLLELELFRFARQDAQVLQQETNEKKLLDFDTLEGREDVIVFYDRFFSSPLSSRIKALDQLIRDSERQKQRQGEKVDIIDQGKLATLSRQEIKEKTGLTDEDFAFLENIITPIVVENSKFFNKVIFSVYGVDFKKPAGEGIDKDKQRSEKGVVQILTNTPVQNALDLAASALALKLPHDLILERILFLFALPQNVVTHSVRQLIRNYIEILSRKEKVSLAEIYSLSAQLTNDLRALGVNAPIRSFDTRRIVGIRSHLVQALRQEYTRNPQGVKIFLKYFVLKHEEGHTMSWPVLAHYLVWQGMHGLKPVFSNPKEAFELFRELCLGKNYPMSLIRAGFPPGDDLGEYRTQADVLIQSLILYGFDYEKKEPYGINWKEAIANYTAFLNLIKSAEEEKVKNKEEFLKMTKEGKKAGFDEAAAFALEIFAQAFNVDFHMDRPNNPGLVLDLSFRAYAGFLTPTQSAWLKKRVLELYYPKVSAAKPAVSLDDTSVMFVGPKPTIKLYSSILPLGIFGVAGAMQHGSAFNYNISTGEGVTYLIAAAAVGAAAYLVRRFITNRSQPENVTTRLIKNNDINGLEKYYKKASFLDKLAIIETVRKIAVGRERIISPEKLEPVLAGAFFETAEELFTGMHSSIISALPVQPATGERMSADNVNFEFIGLIQSVLKNQVAPEDLIAASTEMAKLLVQAALRNRAHDRPALLSAIENNELLKKYFASGQAGGMNEAAISGIIDRIFTGIPFAAGLPDNVFVRLNEESAQLSVSAEGLTTEEAAAQSGKATLNGMINKRLLQAGFKDYFEIVSEAAKNQLQQSGWNENKDMTAAVVFEMTAEAVQKAVAGRIEQPDEFLGAVYANPLLKTRVIDMYNAVRFEALWAIGDFLGAQLGTVSLVSNLKAQDKKEKNAEINNLIKQILEQAEGIKLEKRGLDAAVSGANKEAAPGATAKKEGSLPLKGDRNLPPSSSATEGINAPELPGIDESLMGRRPPRSQMDLPKMGQIGIEESGIPELTAVSI